jgi:hypothetical protein
VLVYWCVGVVVFGVLVFGRWCVGVGVGMGWFVTLGWVVGGLEYTHSILLKIGWWKRV